MTLNVAYRPYCIEHHYGTNVHILKDPFSETLLSQLCQEKTQQPHLNQLVTLLYQRLLHEVVATEFPTIQTHIDTRMKTITPHGIWKGDILSPEIKSIVVSIARAGILPSHVIFDKLHEILTPQSIRQDHLSIHRNTDPEGHIDGATIDGSKIGEDWRDSYIFLPDPMGGTGTTIEHIIKHYQNKFQSTPVKIMALHLIITPEYLLKITRACPEVIVYTFRLDRGLSSPEILKTTPGTHWEQECGLTDHGYIVPGAGGLGEVMNNVFV